MVDYLPGVKVEAYIKMGSEWIKESETTTNNVGNYSLLANLWLEKI